MGLLLRSWRDRRGLSLHELADKAGVSYVTIARIESERMSPTVSTLEKLAQALGITVRDFFPREKPRKRRGKR